MASYAVFAGAFTMRPLGGVVLGYVGDRYGRKRALEISIVLMVIPSVAIGCLPPVSVAGGTATVMLVILRLLQGVAVGGELIGSLLYTCESAPPPQRAFWTAVSVGAELAPRTAPAAHST